MNVLILVCQPATDLAHNNIKNELQSLEKASHHIVSPQNHILK